MFVTYGVRERANQEEETLLEVQFQKLLRIPLQKDELKHGRRSLKKNRLLQIMPCIHFYRINHIMCGKAYAYFFIDKIEH